MRACVFKPPGSVVIPGGRRSVFLAGSIEMGAAEDWQAEVTNALADLDVVVLNPRRDDWDASWVQSIDNPQFREQVEWELDGFVCTRHGIPQPRDLAELGAVLRTRLAGSERLPV